MRALVLGQDEKGTCVHGLLKPRLASKSLIYQKVVLIFCLHLKIGITSVCYHVQFIWC